MLEIAIEKSELWDAEKEEFIYIKKQKIQLEHSLVSISKWESKWHKPFLNKKEKTKEEVVDYIRCMTITQNVDPNVYRCLSNSNFEKVDRYINDPMTATSFSESGVVGKGNTGEQTTSEVIYYWMIALNIPFECQKWHLNRLLALIKVCNIKNSPGKKMGKQEILRQNAELNARRKKCLNTKG